MKKHNFIFLAVLHAICLSSVYGSSFKIAVLPDTQSYSKTYSSTFTAQTQWIVDNKASQSIAFVTHLGDVVNNGQSQMYQWTNADNALDLLNGQLPYSICIGNHDYDVASDMNDPFGNGATTFKSYFGSSRYSGCTWYKGASPYGLSHYQIFSAGGRQWLHFNFEFEADNSILMWAQSIIDANPTLPVIISTHSFIGLRTGIGVDEGVGFRGAVKGGDAANGSSEMWYKFISHNDQIFMVLCGHRYGEECTSLKNDYGKDVYFMLTDYQYRDNGGDGWMRLLEFDMTNNHINATTFSPTLPATETDANSQFTLNINFNTRFSNFGVRETVTGIKAANIKVTSGSVVDVNVIPGQTTGDIGLVSTGTNDYTIHNMGDYYIQVGSRCEDDTMGGVLISSIAQNGIDYGYGWDYYHTSASNIWGHGQISAGVQITDAYTPDGYGGMTQRTNMDEGDSNVAVAYFPFSQFIGAHCEMQAAAKIYSAAGNGILFGDHLTQYPNSSDDPCLVVNKVAGDPWGNTDSDRGIFEINLPGVNSLTDGIILANTNDNGDNYITVSPHEDGKGWQIATLDNGAGSATECSGFSFVYVPYSTPGIVAGRFKANSCNIVAGTGGFKVEPIAEGIIRLRIYDRIPADGALLITGENQYFNSDDFHTYQPDDVNSCWIIESRDLPEAKLIGTSTEHFVFAFVSFDGQSVTPPFSGSGTAEDPFKIYTKTDLENVNYWPISCYILMNNINLSGTTYDNSCISAFGGSFDGQGYSIQNLTINATSKDYLGLFGRIDANGHVSNLTISNVNVTGDKNYVGGLTGENNGTVTNCHTTGSVAGFALVGGLVGNNTGTVTNSYSSANVTGNGSGVIDSNAVSVGGLIGQNFTPGNVNTCYATGMVQAGNGADYVGGLAGKNNRATITNSYATGAVSGSGYAFGGLVGYNEGGSIDNSHATGNVTVQANSNGGDGDYIGGFVGYNKYYGSTTAGIITNSYSTGIVDGNDDHVGGFVGYNYGKATALTRITHCYSTGNVTAGGINTGGFAGFNDTAVIEESNSIGSVTNTASDSYQYIGGFVGHNEGILNEADASVSNCNSTGSVYVLYAKKSIGGFAGINSYGSISGCYSEGNVTTSGSGNNERVGGFVGYLRAASISNCHAKGNVNAVDTAGVQHIGGFAGSTYAAASEPIATVNNCYATGSVVTDSSLSGGFVGYVTKTSIANCYATGSVTSTDEYGAGFVGQSSNATIEKCYATGNANSKFETGGFGGRLSSGSVITNCYATGSATSSGNRAGGFAGGIYGAVTKCYATGTASAANTEVGGIAGCTNANAKTAAADNFWDTQTSGLTASSGTAAYQVGTGKTTAQMKQLATFTNWDFTTPIWKIRENLSYPKLAWQLFSGGNIDYDNTVDFADLKIIADHWLQTGTNVPGDIHIDTNNIVNFLDFADFAEDWMQQ